MQIKTSNTILYCRKWKETVSFYRDVLKLDLHFVNDWFVEFSLNSGARLSIANEESASIKSCSGNGITICFQIDDIQIMHTCLMNLRVNPTQIKVIWGSKAFYVYDPEGNRIEFWSETLGNVDG
ncbi:VOC family protein [Desulforhopalus sp. IMCC35007]|uniref:VOC family protein n=1 Tax=Desulforhopalus sp. IMCC35007 TaxID=2569543 RepID=UPI0010ADD5C5|nr:VOC family protein [Desulforhopalus sp. IMCC35007]TKB06396.1 VOC family protein [Desulforhopalus sp. IMCC35007]